MCPWIECRSAKGKTSCFASSLQADSHKWWISFILFPWEWTKLGAWASKNALFSPLSFSLCMLSDGHYANFYNLLEICLPYRYCAFITSVVHLAPRKAKLRSDYKPILFISNNCFPSQTPWATLEMAVKPLTLSFLLFRSYQSPSLLGHLNKSSSFDERLSFVCLWSRSCSGYRACFPDQIAADCGVASFKSSAFDWQFCGGDTYPQYPALKCIWDFLIYLFFNSNFSPSLLSFGEVTRLLVLVHPNVPCS